MRYDVDAVSISYRADILGEMYVSYVSLLSLAIGKIEGWTRLFSLGLATGLGEGKL